MLDVHWASMRLRERWDWPRYVRLCEFLQMTPYELASLVMLRHKAVDSFRDFGALQINRREAMLVGLMLTLVEAHVMGAWGGDVIENPFPNLTNIPRGDVVVPKAPRVPGKLGRPRKHPRPF